MSILSVVLSMRPTGATKFCSLMAAFTSSGVRLYIPMRSGFSQILTPYCSPIIIVLPTPAIRLMAGITLMSR